MLFPRYSLRLLLVVTTACCLFFYVVLQATRGQLWAISISVTVGALAATLLLHGVSFLAAWFISASWLRMSGRPMTRSPFAADSPPPQILSPTDSDP